MKLTKPSILELRSLSLVFGRPADMKTRLSTIIAARRDGSWVRAESVSYLTKGIELRFVVLSGRRGRPIARWRITCNGVRELCISDLDGGGIRLYPSSHPAAKQYSADSMELQWTPSGRAAEALGALLTAHERLLDDWVPFERYTSPVPRQATVVRWRGPDFVMRTYGRALRKLGLSTKLLPRQARRRAAGVRCLHFGDSFVVSERFTVVSDATGLPNKELKLTKRG
jgi:hypothetical protein